ncbi:MAG: hypothetical protein AB1776_03035 [Bacillota bacterium]
MRGFSDPATDHLLVVFLGALGFGLTAMLLPLVARLLACAGFVRLNYMGRSIPQGAGIIFFIVPLFLGVFMFLVFVSPAGLLYPATFLFVAGAMGFLGLVDDVFGSREASGLRGHFRALMQGRPTTGALKALGGVAVALAAGVATAPLGEVWLNALLIALAANAVNLLDLRPGRAGKGFLLGAAPLFFAGWENPGLLLPLAVVTGALLAYLPGDLRARFMMGDAGANVLGATLGLTAVWVLGFEARLGVLAGLVLFHLFTERYSLSEVVRRNRWLYFLDRLGRSREESGEK